MAPMGGDEYFENPHHALATGMILGALVGASKSDNDLDVKVIKPFMDSQGNYTNQILVRVAGKEYTLTVDSSISEAMRD